MKFVHAADLHLDSPLRGLERYEGAPVEKIRGATRRAFQNLIDLCLTERVDFLLLSGDIYDGDWKDYNTGLFFAAELSRLRPAGIRVCLIRGNHDAQSQITRHLELPANVHEFDTQKPECLILDALGVAIHGQGFATKAVTDDLAANYPDAISGLFNIGMLHTCVSGRKGHETYAPCTVDTLASKGYDYWALGHIHTREILSDNPYIVFPGNLQGRHAREPGNKGATLVTVDDGHILSVEHRTLDVVRWCVCRVDITDAQTTHDVIDLVRQNLEQRVIDSPDKTVAAQVVLCGVSRAHALLNSDLERWNHQIRLTANDIEGDGVWVERIRYRTQAPIDLEGLQDRADAIGQLARSLHELRDDEATLTHLLAEFSPLKNRLPPEVRDTEDGIPLDEIAFIKEALVDVEQLLLSRLLSKTEV